MKTKTNIYTRTPRSPTYVEGGHEHKQRIIYCADSRTYLFFLNLAHEFFSLKHKIRVVNICLKFEQRKVRENLQQVFLQKKYIAKVVWLEEASIFLQTLCGLCVHYPCIIVIFTYLLWIEMKEKGDRKRGEDADGVSILPPTHPALPPPSYPQPNQPYLPISFNTYRPTHLFVGTGHDVGNTKVGQDNGAHAQNL